MVTHQMGTREVKHLNSVQLFAGEKEKQEQKVMVPGMSQLLSKYILMIQS